jgi:hypothetical protein
MGKCTAFDIILLYQRTFYLLFPINYFLKMYRVSFILGDCVFIEMKCTKQSAIGCIFQWHAPEMKCTKPSYSCLHLRRNMLEKNTIYSCTRTLIGQKTFSIYVQRTKLFLAKTLYMHLIGRWRHPLGILEATIAILDHPWQRH